MVKTAKSAIESGAIGDVRAVQATCWFYKPDYYFDVAPWRTKKGAGPISVNLVHDVDLLRHFCGEVKSVRAISVPSKRGLTDAAEIAGVPPMMSNQQRHACDFCRICQTACV